MPSTSRRVSYVLSPPTAPVPYLALPPLDTPRHGSPRPILQPRAAATGNPFGSSAGASFGGPTAADSAAHPRHCLGVAAIALDTTTQLAGRAAPEGILYSGGRDGLVAAWETGLRFRRRTRPRWAGGRRRRVDWERLEEGVWDEEAVEDGDEEGSASGSEGSESSGEDSADREGADGEESVSLMGGPAEDGAMGNGRARYTSAGRSRGRGYGGASTRHTIPFEDTWQVNTAALEERAVSRAPLLTGGGRRSWKAAR